MDYPDKDLSKFDFSISMILLFNPKLLPKVPKPSESDYQDTKILYYYPEELIKQEEKRNQVGLIEGSYYFWENFSDNSKKDDASQSFGFQIIYLDDYIHILKEVEKDFWLFMVIKPNTTIQSFKITDIDYLNSQSFSYDENSFGEENCKKFLQHFYQNFFIFYGSFSSFFSVEDNAMNQEFNVIMRPFIRNYITLNSHYGQFLNILKFNFTGVNYSPIDKRKFLSLQYLINILQAIENRLEHFALFYSGYFVFSTFDQKDLQLLYDYFYITYNSCEMDQLKIVNKFEKLKSDEKINGIYYGILNKPNNSPNGFIYGPLSLNDQKANGAKNDDFILFAPKISIFDNSKKTTIKQNLFSFYEKNLLLLMTCNTDAGIEKNRFLDIQTAICTNSEKVSQNLEKQLLKITNQVESYRMIYFNKMNLAVKISNKINFSSLDYETLKFIDDIKTELETKNKMIICFKKSVNYWIYGLKGNSRIVTFLIPGNISFQKVEEEKEEIMKFFFSNIFI